MLRSARVLVLAILVAVSLVGSASTASASTGHGPAKPPVVQPLDITWE